MCRQAMRAFGVRIRCCLDASMDDETFRLADELQWRLDVLTVNESIRYADISLRLDVPTGDGSLRCADELEAGCANRGWKPSMWR